MFASIAVAVLASLCIIPISVRFLAGWRQNFGLFVVVLSGAAAVYVQTYPLIVGICFPVGLLIGFLLCVPFINENKAKTIAKQAAEQECRSRFGPNSSVAIHGVKLDNWTWHVNGGYALSVGIGPFSVDVHAKCGTVVRLNFP